MKDGELLFVAATANTEQVLLKESMKDLMVCREPLEILTDAVMQQRVKLRTEILGVEDVEAREKVLEKYVEDLHDFHVSYLNGLIAMNLYKKYSDMKALPFLSYYTRYKKMLDLVDKVDNFLINVLELDGLVFDIQEFLLSSWDVLIYVLDKPLHDEWDMEEVTPDSVIEEVDWDGVKPKKGREIIRRNGECGGRVVAFVYVEEVDSEGEENVRMVHFYSISVDGKTMRHFKHERRW